jgi:hypothetical protein
MTPTFQGEVQFRRWSDSSTQGVQITFALPDASDLEPLKAKAGKRFMAVLVEIGDDEQPVQPPVKVGPLCREAVDLCKVPQFWAWLTELGGAGEVTNEEEARSVIQWCCKVSSRKELDTNPAAGHVFVTDFRVPFMHWQRKQKQ